jgi:hypothetical protein
LSSTAISKIISPQDPNKPYYAFVDLSNADEAHAAMEALNGTEPPWGGHLRVGMAKGGGSWKTEERSRWEKERRGGEYKNRGYVPAE